MSNKSEDSESGSESDEKKPAAAPKANQKPPKKAAPSKKKKEESSEESEVEEEDDESSVEEEEDEKPVKKAQPKRKAPAKRKATSKKRDPNHPKRPLTSYMFYVKAKRGDYAAKYPGMKFGDLSKKIASAWKALEPDEKKPFEDENLKDKKRYEEEMKNYTKPESGSDESDADSEDDDKKKKKPQKKKAKKDPNAPKKGLNAYMYFTKENRDKVKAEKTGLKPSEISKELGIRWKKLSPAEKKPYEEMAKKDKERYEKEFEKYNQ